MSQLGKGVGSVGGTGRSRATGAKFIDTSLVITQKEVKAES
jgi:hypothetical protein